MTIIAFDKASQIGSRYLEEFSRLLERDEIKRLVTLYTLQQPCFCPLTDHLDPLDLYNNFVSVVHIRTSAGARPQAVLANQVS